MNTRFFSALFAIILFYQTSFAQTTHAVAPQDLAEGMPEIAKDIGAHSFVPVELEELKDAKVWYVDYEWHRQHGIEIPADGIKNEKFIHDILQAYGYQARGVDDHDGQFTGKKKTAYADYYGGMGAGINHGSGRAAAFGLVQIKGTKTSLAKETDPWHSNGAVQTIEAVDEAIWSQILDGEFKYGSNKVIAIILTGTYGVMKQGNQVFPRALIVREMAVRPAHYMLSPARQYWSTAGDGALDTARVQKSLPHLLKNLPYPEGFKSTDPNLQLRTGILELVHREALAQAEYVAQRLFFGSYSPSNMEITGRRLDLGDHTAQEGYSPIYRVAHIEHTPFGKTQAFLQIFEEFRSSLEKTLDPASKQALPSADEIRTAFDQAFIKNRSIELARLSGVPHETLAQLGENAAVLKLGEVLWNVSQIGQPKTAILADPNGWKNSSRYDINKILIALADNKVSDLNSVTKVVEKFIGDETVSTELSRAYAEFLFAVQKQSRGEISAAALRNYMKAAAPKRNLTRTSVIRGHKRWRELWDTTDKSIGAHADQLGVQNYIEQQVEQNRTLYKDAAPYTVVIREKANTIEGSTLRDIYDAKTNRSRTELKITIKNGIGMFKGQKFTTEQLRELKVNYQKSGGENAAVQGRLSDSAVVFRLANIADLNFADIKLEAAANTKPAGFRALQCSKLFAM